jgi:hypothetical protein
MIGIAWTLISGKIVRAFTWATANAGRMLAILLALAVLWAVVERNGRHKAQKVLASTEQAYRNAQADAAKALAERDARQVATNEAVNKGSTDDNAQRVYIARSAVAAYARLHPVNRCAPRETQPAAVPDNSGMDAGPGGSSGMVAVTIEDANTLAAGTVRAESCRAWGAAMIDAGLAEAGD